MDGFTINGNVSWVVIRCMGLVCRVVILDVEGRRGVPSYFFSLTFTRYIGYSLCLQAHSKMYSHLRHILSSHVAFYHFIEVGSGSDGSHES